MLIHIYIILYVGTIPVEFVALPKLTGIYLYNNKLEGN